LGLIALLLLALTLGPDLLLKAMLTRVLPSESGLAVSYDRAEAGFFFRSVTIDNLNINDREDELRFSAGHLGLKRLSFFNLLRLVKNPRMDSSSPLSLAGEVNLRGLSLQRKNSELMAVDFLEAREPAYQPRAAAPGLPRFDKLEVRGFRLAAEEPDDPQVSFSRLEARALGPDFLGGLKLEGLEWAGRAAENRAKIDLSWLSIGGLPLVLRPSLVGSISSILDALWVCETLEMAPTVVTLDGREALNISSVLFDTASAPDGSPIYTRRFNFTVDSEVLDMPKGLEAPARKALFENFGGRLELGLDLEVQPGDGSANLKELRIQSPELGQLTASARLSGLSPRHSGAIPKGTELLLTAAWGQLEALSLTFADQGLMQKWYRYLDDAAFKYAPSRNSADNIMAYYLEPLAQKLDLEQRLANLPVLLSEARVFLEHPESLTIAAAPPQPLPVMSVLSLGPLMSLANLDKYDIIEKLHLTAQVNDRAPVAVAARAGVFHERLPNAPRPMETLFEEDLE
jgi:hypothetical protein